MTPSRTFRRSGCLPRGNRAIPDVTVLYRGSVKAIRVLVPVPAKGTKYPTVPEVNNVDKEVFTKLKMMNVVPSDLSTDEMFLRRLYIDAISQLPPSDVIREFVADKDPKKRAKR